MILGCIPIVRPHKFRPNAEMGHSQIRYRWDTSQAYLDLS
jgi:hypothetical protein